MKDLRLIEGPLPEGFKSDFESFLFNEEKHRLLQAATGWTSYFLVREGSKKAMAAVHFHVENHIASSPYRAPFGSVEFSEKLQPKTLYEFLAEVESNLKAKNVRRVVIKNPPDFYRPFSSVLLGVLLFNLGYRSRSAEMTTFIRVDDTRYEQKIDAGELPKLDLAKKENLAFQEVPIQSLEEIYEFNRACREERNQSLSMTLEELTRAVHAYEDKFVLFAVFRSGALAAACISIRVSPTILYNFYLGHPKSLDFLSPVVFLMDGIYQWSQQHNIVWIDLGTSALDGQPNFSLLDFKLRLSGRPSAKLTFEKDLYE